MMKVAIVGSSPVLEKAAQELEAEGVMAFSCHIKYEWMPHEVSSGDRLYIGLKPTLTNGLSGFFSDVDLSYLSADVLDDLSWAENTVFSMMGRIDPLKQYTYEKRKLLYHYLLCYWLQTIDACKFDLVVFESAPHEISDFVFFLLCKRANISVLIFNYTRLPRICYVSDTYGGPVTDAGEQCGEIVSTATNEIHDYLDKLRRPYAVAMPNDLKEFLDNRGYIENVTKRLVSINGRLLVDVARKIKTISRLILRFDPVVLRDVLTSKINNREWRAVKDDYAALSKNFAKPLKYVYFLLNFQPENTTCPLGDRYVDQYVAISTIARWLPKNYSIVVKENPVQLHDFSHYNVLGRDGSYYRRLARIPNLVFAPTNSDHFDLLDSSLCVASVNGSVGWEAVVRRKPALVFGNAWYQTAPGVFRIKRDVDCLNAITQILAGVEITDEMVERFANLAVRSGAELCLTADDAKIHGVNFEVTKNVPAAKSAIRHHIVRESMRPRQ